MSRSFHKQANELPIATEVIRGNVLSARHFQYRRRAKLKKKGSGEKNGPSTLRTYKPPVGGWVGCGHAGTAREIQK